MSEFTGVAVFGAAGRMGQALLRVAPGVSGLRIVAAILREDSSRLGEVVSADVGEGLRYTSGLPPEVRAGALLDFSGAGGFDAALSLALARKLAFVSGSTGLAPAQRAALTSASQQIPTLWSANFSLGVAVLARLAAEAARLLRDFDCEIVELHHRHKRDAPSGTALALGRAVAAARGLDFERVARRAREGLSTAGRGTDEIGLAALRGGDIVGEHTLLFAGAGERVELRHLATDRDIFARGALLASRQLAGRAPGRYDFGELLTGGSAGVL